MRFEKKGLPERPLRLIAPQGSKLTITFGQADRSALTLRDRRGILPALMPSGAETFSKFPAKDPRSVLRRLAERPSADLPVLLTLYTRGGHSFGGRLLKIGQDSREDQVLLQCTESNGALADDVLYVPLVEIVAVRVHRCAPLSPILSDGAIAYRSGENAPSRLELRRSLVPEILSRECGVSMRLTVDWDRIPETGDALLNLRDLARALQGSLKAIASDTTGRDALTQVGTVALLHRSESALAVSRSDGALELAVDLARALPDALERELKTKLEAAL